MIDCKHACKIINDYIDGTLTDENSAAFEEHISCCEKCHAEYDMIKTLSADLKKSTSPLPDGFARRMHIALVNEQFEKQEKRSKSKVPFSYTRFATAAVAAIIVVVGGKYGVYDVYKNVTNESNIIATEYASETGIAEKGNEQEIVVETEKTVSPEISVKNTDAEKTSQKNTNTGNEKTSEKSIEETFDGAALYTNETKDVPLQSEEIALLAEGGENELNGVAPASFARTAEPVNGEVADEVDKAEETVQISALSDEENNSDSSVANEKISEDMVNLPADTSSSDTGSEGEESEAEKQSSGSAMAKDSETSSPAVVIIDKSGDGSMLVFKKYLYTFLNTDEITENGDEITITVSSDEYGAVIEKISQNEYVKSITMGTFTDGVAVIVVK